MVFKERYERRKQELINNKDIKPINRRKFKDILDYLEKKLRRKNGLETNDEANYKTLLTYIDKCRNINKWFLNKDLTKITETDIKRVYEGLEDGILKPNGDRANYYAKFMKSKPFEILGKKEIAIKVIEYTFFKKPEVEFITEEDFRNIMNFITNLDVKILLWLLIDYGENIFSMLQLVSNDCEIIRNLTTGEEEVKINFRKDIIKRSRTPRALFNNYVETAKLLIPIIRSKDKFDLLFTVNRRTIEKQFKTACEKANVKLRPKNEEIPTLKHLRNSMMNDLLVKGFSTDEIKKRAGHKPSSNVIDRYVTYHALNDKPMKKKFIQGQTEKFSEDLEKFRFQDKIKSQEIESLKQDFEDFKQEMKQQQKIFLKQLVEQYVSQKI